MGVCALFGWLAANVAEEVQSTTPTCEAAKKLLTVTLPHKDEEEKAKFKCADGFALDFDALTRDSSMTKYFNTSACTSTADLSSLGLSLAEEAATKGKAQQKAEQNKIYTLTLQGEKHLPFNAYFLCKKTAQLEARDPDKSDEYCLVQAAYPGAASAPFPTDNVCNPEKEIKVINMNITQPGSYYFACGDGSELVPSAYDMALDEKQEPAARRFVDASKIQMVNLSEVLNATLFQAAGTAAPEGLRGGSTDKVMYNLTLGSLPDKDKSLGYVCKPVAAAAKTDKKACAINVNVKAAPPTTSTTTSAPSAGGGAGNSDDEEGGAFAYAPSFVASALVVLSSFLE